MALNFYSYVWNDRDSHSSSLWLCEANLKQLKLELLKTKKTKAHVGTCFKGIGLKKRKKTQPVYTLTLVFHFS